MLIAKKSRLRILMAETLRLNAFASLIDIVSLERVLKPFEPLKAKEH